MTRERTVIVLAAGEGKRMKSATAKVLHPLLGRTLLGHVLATVAALRAERCVVVVGNGADEVSAHVAQIAPDAQCVLQAEQRGTGHAARVGLEAIPGARGTVIIINADVPLLRPQTLTDLVAAHDTAGTPATILTATVDDPTGLGRIIRNPATGSVEAIVEDRDTTAEQRAITEINVGLYVFDAAVLGPALGKLTTHNDQREEYLPDVVGLLADAGHGVTAVPAPDLDEVRGCNDRVELAALRALLRERTNEAWMRAGVTIIDPATTWIDVTATVGRDVVLEPNTQLRGRTQIADGAVIGPETTLTDTTVGAGATLVRVHAVGARIEARAQVGPFAYLRPGTVLLEAAKVGAFVEVKNSQLGEGAKVPHLSYVGDATVGARANLGAGTIVVNYDGQHKHHTTVGEGAFIGCDTSLIAPVEVGPGAYVAAGSVINRKVTPGALGVSRAPQREIAGWVLRRRAGTASAKAAETALAAETVPGAETAPATQDVTSGRAPAAGDPAPGDTADG